MIILGDNLVPCESFSFISSVDEISSTKPNCTLIFDYNESILKYCYENNLNCAVIVKSIKEAIYTNSLNGKYIISEFELSKQLQNIAESYMFDSKNITVIKSNEEFETVANAQIDGLIYSRLLN